MGGGALGVFIPDTRENRGQVLRTDQILSSISPSNVHVPPLASPCPSSSSLHSGQLLSTKQEWERMSVALYAISGTFNILDTCGDRVLSKSYIQESIPFLSKGLASTGGRRPIEKGR